MNAQGNLYDNVHFGAVYAFVILFEMIVYVLFANSVVPPLHLDKNTTAGNKGTYCTGSTLFIPCNVESCLGERNASGVSALKVQVGQRVFQ